MAGRRRTLTSLRPLRSADLEALATWLPRAAAEAGCPPWASADTFRDWEGSVYVAVADPAQAVLAFEARSPAPDAARVRFLAVAPGKRRLGIGSRAALALERRLRASTVRLYVLVPERLGLALYFWLRLGYRPLTRGEWPAAPGEAALWLVRALR